MKGSILGWEETEKSGVITGENGMRFAFTKADWKGNTLPSPGVVVDFLESGEIATEVYPMAAANSGANRIAAALLAFFLGSLGFHKFYMGYTKQGIIMLVCSLAGFVLLGIPTLLMYLISFIEAICYITKSDADFQRIYVEGKKAWF